MYFLHLSNEGKDREVSQRCCDEVRTSTAELSFFGRRRTRSAWTSCGS